MKPVVLLLFFCLLACPLAAQKPPKQLSPKIGTVPDLSPAAQQRQQRLRVLGDKVQSAAEKIEYERLAKTANEDRETVWDVTDIGCSWYCGGGPYQETASSALSAAHAVHHAHDLSLRHAWVEGVPGPGIGQFVTYYFKNDAPRINQINVYNGYVKSPALWQANGRVKKLKLWVNNQPYAELNLKDTPALQSFAVPLLGHRADKKDLVLRFEIREVYRGTKYEDTALTEVFFDGVDVH